MRTAREGFISYKEFKVFVQEAEAEKDSRWVSFFVVAAAVDTFPQEIQVGQVLRGDGAREEDGEVASTNVHPNDQPRSNYLLLRRHQTCAQAPI